MTSAFRYPNPNGKKAKPPFFLEKTTVCNHPFSKGALDFSVVFNIQKYYFLNLPPKNRLEESLIPYQNRYVFSPFGPSRFKAKEVRAQRVAKLETDAINVSWPPVFGEGSVSVPRKSPGTSGKFSGDGE